MADLFDTDSGLRSPFDRWPRWAIDIDVELSDMVGTLTNDDIYDQDDFRIIFALEVIEDIRRYLRVRMVG